MESVRSVLPLVSEFVVNVGQPDRDGTERRLMASLASSERRKVRVLRTEWDPRWTERMRIFAVQTNLAMYACRGDWLVYIQGDEVLHEEDYPRIREALARAEADARVEGLVFDYLHFWGGGEYVLDTPAHYQSEVRVVRNFRGVASWKDAQGFRIDGRKLRVLRSGARVFHYGYAVPPELAWAKAVSNSRLYRGEEATRRRRFPEASRFYEEVNPFFLRRFGGTHPRLMGPWLARLPGGFDPSRCRVRWTAKQVKRTLQTLWYRLTGLRWGGYRNYVIVG